MRRIGVDPAYLGTDGDVLPPDPHPVRAIEDRASQRPRRLEADEQYRRLPSPQIMPQMMANAPCLTHPRSRHADCAGQAVEPRAAARRVGNAFVRTFRSRWAPYI